jgi:hypothetical protein
MSNAVDLSALLSESLDKVKRPPVKPAGTYHAIIADFKFDISSKSKTPYCQFMFTQVRPGADIDPAQLVDEDGTPIDLSKWKPSTQGLSHFYLSENAKFRLKEFLEALGINTSGRTFNETIPEARGCPVLLTVSMEASEDGNNFYNQVKSVDADKGE